MALLVGTALLIGMAGRNDGLLVLSGTVKAESQTTSAWSDAEFRQVATKTNLSDRTLKACREVLVLGTSPQAAAIKVQMDQAQISRGLRTLRDNR
jgi:hypothetical protein